MCRYPSEPVSHPGTELDRALRTTYFEHLVLTDSALATRVSVLIPPRMAGATLSVRCGDGVPRRRVQPR